MLASHSPPPPSRSSHTPIRPVTPVPTPAYAELLRTSQVHWPTLTVLAPDHSSLVDARDNQAARTLAVASPCFCAWPVEQPRGKAFSLAFRCILAESALWAAASGEVCWGSSVEAEIEFDFPRPILEILISQRAHHASRVEERM